MKFICMLAVCLGIGLVVALECPAAETSDTISVTESSSVSAIAIPGTAKDGPFPTKAECRKKALAARKKKQDEGYTCGLIDYTRPGGKHYYSFTYTSN